MSLRLANMSRNPLDATDGMETFVVDEGWTCHSCGEENHGEYLEECENCGCKRKDG